MLSELEIKKNIEELRSLNQLRRYKYARNRSFYENTPRMALEDIKSPSVVGYGNNIFEVNDDTTPTPNLNVIKSCIDTLHSKIAQSKVRPYFNCVNGSFKDINIVKQAQQFFDQYFDIEDVNKKVSEAFRDACIFDTGYIYVDPDNKAITRALPWQVYERPAEVTYNNITRTYYERKDFPVTMLPDFLYRKITERLGDRKYVTFGMYYDAKNAVKAYFIPEYSILEILPYDGNRTPFIRIHYNNPVAGNTSSSVVDMLYTIQLEINSLMNKVKDASQMNMAMTYLLPKGSGVKTGQLNNRIGNIIEYETSSNMTGSPVTVSTPQFIDPSYMQLINELVERAYQLTGVSMLSAQSVKPAGLNSGIALSTMEDVESDRFETQLNQVIRAYVDIAKTCLRVFPKEENILPEDTMRMDIKWADIVEEVQKMQIQFSGADSLSKDPSTKLQQLVALAQAGVIPQSRISQFMEIPDLQSGYSLANNAINAVLSTISDCIDNDVFDIPEYIPLGMLEDEIMNTQLSLRSANYELNRESIKKLSILYSKAVEIEKAMQEEAQLAGQAQQIGEIASDAAMSGSIDEAVQQIQEELPEGESLPVGPAEGGVDVNNIQNEAFDDGGWEQAELPL